MKNRVPNSVLQQPGLIDGGNQSSSSCMCWTWPAAAWFPPPSQALLAREPIRPLAQQHRGPRIRGRSMRSTPHRDPNSLSPPGSSISSAEQQPRPFCRDPRRAFHPGHDSPRSSESLYKWRPAPLEPYPPFTSLPQILESPPRSRSRSRCTALAWSGRSSCSSRCRPAVARLGPRNQAGHLLSPCPRHLLYFR